MRKFTSPKADLKWSWAFAFSQRDFLKTVFKGIKDLHFVT